jgi:hypothetical protein
MGFDVDKCIELHNRIVASACSHLPSDRQSKIKRSCFNAHSLDPSPPVALLPDVELELDDQLTTFLSGIDIVVPEQHHHLAFNLLLVGILPPSCMIPDMWLGILEERDHYILLYIGAGWIQVVLSIVIRRSKYAT